MVERVLEFVVDKQRLTKKKDCDFSNIVAGSVGYLRAKFYFSDEWKNCKKVGSFALSDSEEFPVLLDNKDSCLIPKQALTGDKFFVSVLGGNPKTSYRIKTTKVKVKQEVT